MSAISNTEILLYRQKNPCKFLTRGQKTKPKNDSNIMPCWTPQEYAHKTIMPKIANKSQINSVRKKSVVRDKQGLCKLNQGINKTKQPTQIHNIFLNSKTFSFNQLAYNYKHRNRVRKNPHRSLATTKLENSEKTIKPQNIQGGVLVKLQWQKQRQNLTDENSWQLKKTKCKNTSKNVRG